MAKSAPAGTTIIVSPGVYPPIVFQPGDLQDGLYFFADVTGAFSESPPAPVVIDGEGHEAAIQLSGQSNLTFDSFTLRGGTVAGFIAKSAPGTSVDDCTISENGGDGVQVEGADGGLIFNNLITANGGAGIRVLGTAGLEIINNTVYDNTQSALSVGGPPAAASSDVFVENNIFNHNHAGIVVDASTTGYQGDFNLNTDGYDGTQPGPDDVQTDPLFVFPASGNLDAGADFHLAAESPAIDAGDPNTSADLGSTLTQLTTQSDGTLDSPPPDLGYHYLPPAQAPTPAPKPTHTHSGTPTPTHRPGTPAAGATATPTPKATPTIAGGRKGTATPRPTKTPRA